MFTRKGRGEDDADGRQLERVREAGDDLVEHRAAGARGAAKVADHEPAEEGRELDRQRLPEPELPPELLDLLLAGERAGHEPRGVAW